jgi:ADP-heptose:LPS heptosyltransferase
MKAGIFCKILLMFLIKIVPSKKGCQHLLIIKLDGIGDYVLFRNLLIHIRNGDRYRRYKITLLGNFDWKEIFDHYDSEAVNKAIWIEKKKLRRKLIYRFSMLWRVRFLATSDVLNCDFSRSILLDDPFAFVATGSTKIAMKGDNVNRGENNYGIDKWIYSEIFNTGEDRIFESIAHSKFIEHVLNTKIAASGIGFNKLLPIPVPTENYVVLFLGAGNPERKWPIEYFLKCAEYAWANYGLIPLLCGGSGDIADALKFKNMYSGKAYDYTGKTTLLEYIELVRCAKLTISVDTGPLHIAVAAGCPVIGLFSGIFYKRFAPYPKELAPDIYPIYPDFVDELINDNDEILYDYFAMKNNTIKLIPPEKVILTMNAIKKLKLLVHNEI